MKRFDESLLRQLENIRLAVRKSVRGRKEGEWSTSRRGGAADFVSHRDYLPGDDLRTIDWPLYARIGELFVRQFSREESMTLHLVVDSSPSMRIGDDSKYDMALRLAAGLGAVAWAESARVSLRGDFHGNLGSLIAALDRDESLEVQAGEALRAIPRATRESGMVVLLSDLWEDPLREAVLEASECGDVVLLHILSPPELAPALEGRYRLIDSETSEIIDRQVGPEELATYRDRLEMHCEAWKTWCRDHEMSYVRCASDGDWAEILTRTLRKAGLYR